MKENNSQPCSPKSCSFSFSGVLIAGFFAAILTNLLMVFQGNNVLYYFGALLLGVEADPKMIYLAGIGIAVVLGIIFAFLYALLLAPWDFLNDLVKAIIFAAILTAFSHYLFPQLPSLVNRLAGLINLTSVDLVAQETFTTPGESGDFIKELIQGKVSKEIVFSFTNSLIFSLMVVVLYRRNYCK